MAFIIFVRTKHARALGERGQTTECCLSEAKNTKQGAEGANIRATRGDYATVQAAKPTMSQVQILVCPFVCRIAATAQACVLLCSHSVDFALKKQLSTVFSLLTFRPMKAVSNRYGFYYFRANEARVILYITLDFFGFF